MTLGAGAVDPLRRLLGAWAARGAAPGAVWRVEDAGGAVSSGAVGDAVLEPAAEPATETTPYDLASLTKPLACALAAAVLAERGGLDLDEPAETLLPELAGSPYGEATLLDLGCHRAGLPAWRPLYLRAHGIDAYLEAIATEPPAGVRGDTLYSDLGYIALGAALERAAAQPLDRLFEDLVARPLGLARIGFARNGRGFEDAAATERGNAFERLRAGAAGAGYAWREGVLRGAVHDGNAHGLEGVAGHAGLFGTAADVATLGGEILRGGRLALGPRAGARLLEPVGGPGTRSFGFVMAGDSGAARGVLPENAPGHTGFTGTSIWLDHERGRVYVLLSNRVHPVVPPGDFQVTRREFHAAAAAL